jgi:hypothetical protein
MLSTTDTSPAILQQRETENTENMETTRNPRTININ